MDLTSMNRRKVLWSFIVLVAVTIVGVVVTNSIRRKKAREAALPNGATPDSTEWIERMGDAVPAPVPTELPLVGPVGVDADGYPTQWVDRPAMQSLLRHHRFDDLDRYFADLQDRFEADPRKEYWIGDAAAAFASANADLAVLLDEWLKAKPASWAAYLARGEHRIEMGLRTKPRNGGPDSLKVTAQGKATLALAFEDLDQALALRPKLVEAMTEKLATEPPDAKAILERANVVCPTCFLPKVAYIVSRAPSYGGSYSEMSAFAAGWNASDNPRFAWLAGFVDADQCSWLVRKRDLVGAEAAITRALSHGDASYFHVCRGRIRWHQRDIEGAFLEFDRANSIRHGSPSTLAMRASMARSSGRFEIAGESLRDAVRVDIRDPEVVSAWGGVMDALGSEGARRARAGDAKGASALYDLTWQIQPRDGQNLLWRARVIANKEGGVLLPGDVEPLLASHPDDVGLRQAYDQLLSVQLAWDRIRAMWDAFIATHPNEPLAFMERAGTNHQLGNAAAAADDLKKACDLGWLEGCAGHPH